MNHEFTGAGNFDFPFRGGGRSDGIVDIVVFGGTATVTLFMSPDNGTTWIAVKNLSGAAVSVANDTYDQFRLSGWLCRATASAACKVIIG